MIELGQHLLNFRRMMADVPVTRRLVVFESAVVEAARYVAKGFDRATAADQLRDMAQAYGLNDEDEVQLIISRHFEKVANGKDHSAPLQEPTLQPLPSFDVGDFLDRQIPLRRWCVKDRIPMRNVTLLSGDGATGKTTIALQLAVRVATDQTDWLGAVIDECGPVLFFTAEEELDEMHYRLDLIIRRYGLDFSHTKARLHLICMPGEDCVLGTPNPKGGMLLKTEQYARLRLTIEHLKPKLVVLESSADVYAGNESDRAMVRQFVGMLRALSLDFDCAIVLISHPSLVGLGSGTGTAGSTQWGNSVRSRMYFTREKNTEEDDNSDVRLLKIMKLNYGKQGEQVKVRYDQGLFVQEQTQSDYQRSAREQEIDRLFLVLLERFDREGRQVTDKSGPTYAPAMFAKETAAKSIKASSAMLGDAMLRLFADQKIHLVWEGPPSRRRSRILPGKGPSNDPSNDVRSAKQNSGQSERETEGVL